MTDPKINLTELREYLGPKPGNYEFTWNGDVLLAFIDIAQAAHEYMNHGLGSDTADDSPLLDALDRFDFA